jgi:hypothetical protein
LQADNRATSLTVHCMVASPNPGSAFGRSSGRTGEPAISVVARRRGPRMRGLTRGAQMCRSRP